MIRSISASVGINGVNRPDDVRTIQELLNAVPTISGGPSPPLEVDGLCGPKTKAAIQKFQLHHFGWAGADGRVDPNGRTHLKLLTFQSVTTPAPPPPPAEPESSNWWIQRLGNKEIFGTRPEEYFFRVIDKTNGRAALYWFGGRGVTPPVGQAPLTLFSPLQSFTTRGPHPISKLGAAGAYISTETPGGQRSSCLLLNFSSGAVRIPMPHHIIGPGGGTTGPGTLSQSGEFQFVKMLALQTTG